MEYITGHICMTKDIGIHGNLFGGVLLAWIDEAAAMFVSNKCETNNVVTLTVDKLEFKRPIKVGQHIRFYGDILKIGNSSVTIKLTVKRFNVLSKLEQEVCSTTLVFVRIDDSTGEPIPIDKTVKAKLLQHHESTKA